MFRNAGGFRGIRGDSGECEAVVDGVRGKEDRLGECAWYPGLLASVNNDISKLESVEADRYFHFRDATYRLANTTSTVNTGRLSATLHLFLVFSLRIKPLPYGSAFRHCRFAETTAHTAFPYPARCIASTTRTSCISDTNGTVSVSFVCHAAGETVGQLVPARWQ